MAGIVCDSVWAGADSPEIEGGLQRRDPRSLTLNQVEVREIDPPPDEDPILWRILTTHPVASLADAARIVDLYRLRWTVEQLFRPLKSQPLDIEENMLADGDALERFAATALQAACTVMQLVQDRGEAGRTQEAARLFDPAEITVIKALVVRQQGKTAKQKNPHPAGSLA